MLNLVKNGGGSGTTDWTNPTNGLAEFWSYTGIGPTYSIVTGNGFTTNAQRMYYNSSALDYTFIHLTEPIEQGDYFTFNFKYRSSTLLRYGIISDIGGGMFPYVNANTGNAINMNHQTPYYWSSYNQGFGIILEFYISPVNSGDWFEIDEVTVETNKVDVRTKTISSIGTTTATCGGNIYRDGLSVHPPPTVGVCWSTGAGPTIVNSHTNDTTISATSPILSQFTSNLTGLTANTTYFVRSYLKNYYGNYYGDQQVFTTNQLSTTTPTVIILNIIAISDTSAYVFAQVTSDGGATVTSRGVCWDTNINPTTSDTHTANGNGVGYYAVVLTGLTASTTYYVRSYAYNSMGLAYSSNETFTTTETETIPMKLYNSGSWKTVQSIQVYNNGSWKSPIHAWVYRENFGWKVVF